MMNFRYATAEDIALIQDLARKSWEDAYAEILSQEQIDYMLGTMYSEEELTKHFTKNPHYHYYIIEEDNLPYGFVGFEHHYEPETTKLHRIYLVPEAKGKGLGKAGISLVKMQTEAAGDKRIILNVNKANNAKKVYESQGFTVRKELVLDIGGGYVMDDYMMEYLL